MKIISQQPSFASWSLNPGMKTLLQREAQWPNVFSLPAEAVTLLLKTLFEGLKEVDYFTSLVDTEQFFEFLSKLVKSKPSDARVLSELDNIGLDILKKISLQKQFNAQQAKVATHYLSLLSLMLEPDYCYLFDKPGVSFRAKDFLKISSISFNSFELLSQFCNTLQLSFQSLTFIKNYSALIQTIQKLADSLDKTHVDSNELAAMQLLDTLGMLHYTLMKTSWGGRINVNQAALKLSMQDARNLLYDQFTPYIEENFLQFIVYKFYLSQSYPHSTNLSGLCDSENYQMQCKSDYMRFKDDYRCANKQLPNFLIDIKNNNFSKLELERLCVAMRNAESFIPWMEELGFKPNYNVSQYVLHLADSKKNFLIDKFLFKRNEPAEVSSTVLATYLQIEKSSRTAPLLGSTYTYTTNPYDLTREYIHHLSTLYIKNREPDLTLTEAMSELYSDSICSKKNVHDLSSFTNKTVIFKFLKGRKYFFSKPTGVAYLVNEQPVLFKTLVDFLRNNDSDSFYTAINTFTDNASSIQEFVVWSRQQVDMCNNYLINFPDGHQPPLLFLEDSKLCVYQIQTAQWPICNTTKRLLASSDKDLLESVYFSEAKSANEEFSQQVQTGLPLLLTALFTGFFSPVLDDMGLAHNEKYPSFSAYIKYGFKPFMFAAVTVGLNTILFDQTVETEEKCARLFNYFVMNYLSVLMGQPLTQKIAEKIHNKIVCFFVQMLTWALLWNPSLFLSESNKILPTLFLQLLQGISFKMGEEAYQHGKKICSSASFWRKKPQQPFDTEENFLNNDEEIQMSTISRQSRI
ncbi:MAG: hypothetical protein WAL30_07035 [Candidatus Aquirickettsiella sp.]